ncbi:MAG: acyl-CoA dehydrogenase family protein, partial [Chloroflexi bacterium]|nr:acyl-CoA dehydrogenase family protein [Chloroflexota bacterium]
MTANPKAEVRTQILSTVREFVKRDVIPQAAAHDEHDTYPTELVEQMAEMGLFGITVPEEYGGLGLDVLTFAMIFEELSKGWMSLT